MYGIVPSIEKYTLSHLYELIRDEEMRETKFVFVHCGGPYVKETGFINNTYPNVCGDLSEMIVFISFGVTSKLLDVFEMAPTSKIMHGSDGWNIPELFWTSSLLARKSLYSVFSELLSSGTIDDEVWAFNSTRAVLSDNSKKLHRLGG